MGIVALAIGIILIVSAVRNSQGALFTALGQDVPKFVVWFAAIFAIGAIGFIPGLKPISRLLLALVIIVIIVNNYKKIIAGFQNAWQHPPAAAPAPTTQVKAASGSSGASAPLSFFDGRMQSNPFN